MRFLILFAGLILAGPLTADITSHASVTVSDGLHYQVTTVYRDQHHALFHRVYPERVITQVVDGETIWQRVGDELTAGTPFVEMLVLGHQFQAQLLWPEEFFLESAPEPGIDDSCHCRVTLTRDRFGNVVRLQADPVSGRVNASTTQIADGPRIEYRFDEWQEVGGKSIPFAIRIDDGSRVFNYKFQDVRLEVGQEWESLSGQEAFELPDHRE